MTLPETAIFETELTDTVAIYDVSHLLPVHDRKTYKTRDAGGICRAYVHHSGALGADGFKGVAGSARYSTQHKGWAGLAYHLWLADTPDVDDKGRSVIYRGNADQVRCYHTGGKANTHGLGVCVQGNRTTIPPSTEQLVMLDALLPWLISRFDLELGNGPDRGLSYHSESALWGGSGKRTCPGPHLESYVDAVRTLGG